jgi:hypothetical protein
LVATRAESRSHAVFKRAAYLDGSFGSGKSHFMAVLYAILDGDPDARGKKGLSVISKHAKDVLGYDAIVLLLDELVLWLAGYIGDGKGPAPLYKHSAEDLASFFGDLPLLPPALRTRDPGVPAGRRCPSRPSARVR